MFQCYIMQEFGQVPFSLEYANSVWNPYRLGLIKEL